MAVPTRADEGGPPDSEEEQEECVYSSAEAEAESCLCWAPSAGPLDVCHCVTATDRGARVSAAPASLLQLFPVFF